MHLLIIDNFDSFTFNLVQLFQTLDLHVSVRRNDVPLEELIALHPDALCLSPGPGTPANSGVSMAALEYWYETVPVFGVCLGMQVMNEFFDGITTHAPQPIHGKTDAVRHLGQGIFEGLPSPFLAARYHSLMIDRRSEALRETAWSEDGSIMAIEHISLPLYGVQFHPESFLTEHGADIAANFSRQGTMR